MVYREQFHEVLANEKGLVDDKVNIFCTYLEKLHRSLLVGIAQITFQKLHVTFQY